MRRVCAVIALLICSRVLAVEVSPAEIANRRCLNCHGQSRLATLPPAERATMLAPSTKVAASQPATRPEIYLGDNPLRASVHAQLECVACHQNAKTLPHPGLLGKVSCDTKCHSAANSDFLQGAHAVAVAHADANAPSCVTCHGGHDILPHTARNSKNYP